MPTFHTWFMVATVSVVFYFILFFTVAGQADLQGSKALDAQLQGEIYTWDLLAAQVMQWGWTWCPRVCRMCWSSFKLISQIWMSLVSPVSSYSISTFYSWMKTWDHQVVKLNWGYAKFLPFSFPQLWNFLFGVIFGLIIIFVRPLSLVPLW